MGVSIGLHEEVPFDEGAVTASDWISYPILTMAEAPEIRIVLVHRPETGVQGSETSNALAPSAIASAVFDATGRAVGRLPLRPVSSTGRCPRKRSRRVVFLQAK